MSNLHNEIIIILSKGMGIGQNDKFDVEKIRPLRERGGADSNENYDIKNIISFRKMLLITLMCVHACISMHVCGCDANNSKQFE